MMKRVRVHHRFKCRRWIELNVEEVKYEAEKCRSEPVAQATDAGDHSLGDTCARVRIIIRLFVELNNFVVNNV